MKINKDNNKKIINNNENILIKWQTKNIKASLGRSM